MLRSYPGNFSAYEAAKEERAGRRGAGQRARRQAAGAGRGVDPQGRGSAPHAQRGAHRSGWRCCATQRAARRDALGQVRLEVDAGAAQRQDRGRAAATCRMRFGDKQLIVSDFSATILRGDKVGLIGPNGAGKTTLLKLILGELQPDSGTVRQGTQAAGGLLRPDARGARPGRHAGRHHQPGQRVDRDRRPAQARDELPERLPVLARARQLAGAHAVAAASATALLLARLFALPANVLVLDEPTNDLDIDTLELLEELLQTTPARCSWSATTGASWTTWSPAPSPGKATDGAGPVARVRRRLRGLAAAARARARSCARRPRARRRRRRRRRRPPRRRRGRAAPQARKLSYKEQRELDELPARIEALEAEQKALAELLAERRRSTPKEPQRVADAAGALRADRRRTAGGAGALGGAGRALKSRDRRRTSLRCVAAGCERLTISPACRYRALSRRMARSRSMPGQSAISRRLRRVGAQPLDGRGQRAADGQRATGPGPGATR